MPPRRQSRRRSRRNPDLPEVWKLDLSRSFVDQNNGSTHIKLRFVCPSDRNNLVRNLESQTVLSLKFQNYISSSGVVPFTFGDGFELLIRDCDGDENFISCSLTNENTFTTIIFSNGRARSYPNTVVSAVGINQLLGCSRLYNDAKSNQIPKLSNSIGTTVFDSFTAQPIMENDIFYRINGYGRYKETTLDNAFNEYSQGQLGVHDECQFGTGYIYNFQKFIEGPSLSIDTVNVPLSFLWQEAMER